MNLRASSAQGRGLCALPLPALSLGGDPNSLGDEPSPQKQQLWGASLMALSADFPSTVLSPDLGDSDRRSFQMLVFWLVSSTCWRTVSAQLPHLD